jgi:Predicted nucleotide-binding protein containing TIR-like domain
MRKPRVFIASSRESGALVKILKRELATDADVVAWNDPDVFHAGHTYVDELLRLAKEFDFALFLYEKDDRVISRGVELLAPRDNVIFEHGLFMSQIGRGSAFAVAPRGAVKMLSDMSGVKPLEYDESKEIAQLRESIGKRKDLNESALRVVEQRLDSAWTKALKGVLAEFRQKLKETARASTITVARGPQDVVGVVEPVERLLRAARAQGGGVGVKHLALDMEIAWGILVNRVLGEPSLRDLVWRCIMIDPESPAFETSQSDSVSLGIARERIAQIKKWCGENARTLEERKIVFECRAYSMLPVMHGFLVEDAGLLWSLTDMQNGRLAAHRTRYWEFAYGEHSNHAIQSFSNWFEYLWSTAIAIWPSEK